MWKFLFIVVFSLSPVLSNTINANSISNGEENPAYAKWGQIAMQVTRDKYPNEDIVDYLHIGAVTENETTTEKFKLWLRNDTKEFGVFIDIRFNTDTEEIIEITFEETDR